MGGIWYISGAALDDLIEIPSAGLPYSTMRESGCKYAARTTRWMCVLRLLQGGEFHELVTKFKEGNTEARWSRDCDGWKIWRNKHETVTAVPFT
jgi:hypothetical protein